VSNKKVIILLGSPRKNGNSTALAGEVERGAEEAGAEVESYNLHEMNIRFCTGCGSCREKTSKNCVIDDDMQLLYPRLREADAVVFASPIYWAHVTAQMKVFMDRCFALGGPEGHDLEGKLYGIVLTYANSNHFESGTINAIRTFQDSFSSGIVGIICCNSDEAGSAGEKGDFMERAHQLGALLAR
jgi:multimeric flavodoxin WrbA